MHGKKLECEEKNPASLYELWRIDTIKRQFMP